MTRARSPLLGSLAFGATMLAGCMNMSGLSGSSNYACKAPDGVTCDSVSGTYANAVHNNLPSQRARSAALVPTRAPTSTDVQSNLGTAAATRASLPAMDTASSLSPTPLRSSARILRLWFKPWEDADRDLYDQGYVYVQIDGGQWLIEHAQRQIREAFAPLRPPTKATSSASDAKDGASLLPNLKSAPKSPSVDNPFPGLVPSPARPETSD